MVEGLSRNRFIREEEVYQAEVSPTYPDRRGTSGDAWARSEGAVRQDGVCDIRLSWLRGIRRRRGIGWRRGGMDKYDVVIC